MIVAATKNFLLPNATIIPEFIAFLVVLGVVAKWVVPPINRQITARQRQIADSLTVIEEARTQREQVAAQTKAMLDDARTQARSVLDNANRAAEEIQAEARRRGEEEYARLVARAQGEIDRSRRQAELTLVSEMSDLVVATAERVIDAEIDPSRHRSLIDEAIDAVTSSAQASPGPRG